MWRLNFLVPYIPCSCLLLAQLSVGSRESFCNETPSALSLLQVAAVQNQADRAVERLDADNRLTVDLTAALASGLTAEPFLIHIPKTGGTGMEDAANKSGIHWGRFLSNGAQQFMSAGSSVCSKHHVPPSMLRDIGRQEWSVDDAFCVVRHPYDRLVSEYSYRLSVLGVPRYFLEKDVCQPQGLNLFVQRALLAYVSGKPFAFDCHLLPQRTFVFDNTGKQWCGNVLKLEDFPGAFNNLMQAKGVQVSLPEEKKSFSFAKRCGTLGVKDLWPETIKMIDAAYAEDFREFGYEFSSAAPEGESGTMASSFEGMNPEEVANQVASQKSAAVYAASGIANVAQEAAEVLKAWH